MVPVLSCAVSTDPSNTRSGDTADKLPSRPLTCVACQIVRVACQTATTAPTDWALVWPRSVDRMGPDQIMRWVRAWLKNDTNLCFYYILLKYMAGGQAKKGGLFPQTLHIFDMQGNGIFDIGEILQFSGVNHCAGGAKIANFAQGMGDDNGA